MSSEWLARSSRMRAACSLRRIICLPTGEICQVVATQSRTAWSSGRRHRTGLVRPPRPSPSSTPIRLPFRLESFQGSRVDTGAQEPHCMRNQKFFLRRTGPSESGPPAELRPCPGDRGAPDRVCSLARPRTRTPMTRDAGADLELSHASHLAVRGPGTRRRHELSVLGLHRSRRTRVRPGSVNR